jgi:hypothetical protein
LFARNLQQDPLHLNPYQVGRDANGKCNPADRGFKWEAMGAAHGSTGNTHWHTLEFNVNPVDCIARPFRRDWPNDPGPEYTLIPGLYP